MKRNLIKTLYLSFFILTTIALLNNACSRQQALRPGDRTENLGQSIKQMDTDYRYYNGFATSYERVAIGKRDTSNRLM